MPISLKDLFFLSPSFAIRLSMINLCHFVAGRGSWGKCQREFWVMMYNSGVTGSSASAECMRQGPEPRARPYTRNSISVSLYPSWRFVRLVSKQRLFKRRRQTDALSRSGTALVVVLPVVWRRCHGQLPRLEWSSNEIIKASQTENEKAPVVQGNLVFSPPNTRGIVPHGALEGKRYSAKLAFVHPCLLRLIYY